MVLLELPTLEKESFIGPTIPRRHAEASIVSALAEPSGLHILSNSADCKSMQHRADVPRMLPHLPSPSGEEFANATPWTLDRARLPPTPTCRLIPWFEAHSVADEPYSKRVDACNGLVQEPDVFVQTGDFVLGIRPSARYRLFSCVAYASSGYLRWLFFHNGLCCD